MTEENNNPEAPQPTPEPQQPQKSFLTKITIRILRGIINRLENTVQKLEAPPTPQAETASQEGESQVTATTEETQSEAAQPALEELRGWDKILRRVRDRAPLTQSLPDWFLTTVLVGGTLAIVWGAVAIIPNQLLDSTSTPDAEVSEKPQPPIPLPEEKPVESQPEVTPKEKSQPKPQPETQPEAEPELTPEQGLIAAIQEQVSEITTRYAEGLIESIEANFRDGRLIIAVSEDWFTLNKDRQDELAKEMLARSRQLDFTKLVLTTPDGKLLARSPVVGENMVILQREQPVSPSVKS